MTEDIPGRLLILDDDPHIGKMVKRIAESIGLDARFTKDTDEFFQFVDEWRPTHIGLDLVMPEMDGVEVLLKLARLGCTAKIIITSGVGARVLDAAGRSAHEHGLEIAGILAKPFSPDALRKLLRATPGEGKLDECAPRYAGPRTAASGFTALELRRAIDNHELQLAYQPQIFCATGGVAGFEALVRWVHPKHGLIMPDQFIACAEANGLIDALTDRVLEDATEWYSQRFRGSELTLSVNISSRTTSAGGVTTAASEAEGMNRSFVERIVARCEASALKPEQLILELTESSAMENPVASLALLTRLRMKGFQLSIDDFGTGYSSMLQLVRLPFSEIKIDKSFVITASQSAESRIVVGFIIRLGHSLKLRVIAEGVENDETLGFLRDAGCDLAQGYFIARPMGGAAMWDWIDRGAYPLAAPTSQGRAL